ncbi:acyl-ACP--UDP-N-acetylglucosamine O-acyltransferase [Persephonella sp.]
MSVDIHPTSIVSPKAEIGVNVKIGPFCIIEDDVKIGDNTEILSRVSIKKYTTIGSNCKIYEGVVIGNIPQHLGFKNEKTFVEIGNNVTIREYTTIHRGTAFDDGITKIGNNCYLMAYVHIAHDCKIGNDTIFANAVNIAGHVKVGNYVFIGGMTPIHQFCRVGDYAIIGGASAVNKDIPPFTKASNTNTDKNKITLFGLNTIGLQRRGFSKEQIRTLKEAYRIIFLKAPSIKEGIEEVEKKLEITPEIKNLIEFIKTSKRGVALPQLKK